MKIQLEYFALLKDQRGRSREIIETNAATPRELYGELRERHSFTLEPAALKVAINEEFADWDAALSDKDSVVFIPPVAGG